MQNIQVTQFPGGVGTVKDNSVLQALPVPIPSRASVVFDDFGAIVGLPDQTGYAQVDTGVASVLSALPSAAGILRMVTPGGGDGSILAGLDFAGGSDPIVLAVGQPVWFGARFRTSLLDATGINLFGFGDQASGPASTEGLQLRVFFNTVTLTSVNAVGQTEVSFGNVVADTWYEVSMYWDGVDRVSGQLADTNGNILAGGGFLADANFPTLGMAPIFGAAETGVAPITLDVDWVMFAAGR